MALLLLRVTTDGWHLPSEGSMLIVGSHTGMIAPDTLMFMYDWFRRFGAERLTYGLMHPNVWMVPVYARLTVQLGAVRAHPKWQPPPPARCSCTCLSRGLKIYGDPTKSAIEFTLQGVKDSLNWHSGKGADHTSDFKRSARYPDYSG